MNEEGEVEQSGNVARASAKAGKVDKEPVIHLPAGVVPLSNNSRRSEIIAMMPLFNAPGLDPSWVEPDELKVQEFFDTLHEAYIADEPWLVQDTSQEELDYITARLREARLAEESARLAVEAGSAGGMEDNAAAAEEERELAQWVESAGEASNAGTGAPLIEYVVDESSEEEAETVDPPATGRGRVLRRASSGKPVRPGRAAQPQQTQEGSTRQTRDAAARSW